MKHINVIAFAILFLLSGMSLSAPQDHGIDYDIAYMRYPNTSPSGGPYVMVPQGEHAYNIQAGVDLVIVKPDGTEEVVVDCTTCAVIDPYVSYDGTTIYYAKVLDIPTSNSDSTVGATASYIFKVDVSGSPPYTEVQLTFPGSFDNAKYANNQDATDDPTSIVDGKSRQIRDMSPVPLSDGRILFTSNRHGTFSFKPGTSTINAFPQQMYTMDDHDGTKNTPVLANMLHIDKGNMHMVQHPMQLKDGRILYSSWHDFGHKFKYAMTELFTMHPDGSNTQQFTEPHDHHKNVSHFITQLANEDVVVGWYYPSYDYGFGVLNRYDVAPHNGEFLRDSHSQTIPWSAGTFSKREFDRPNSDNVWIMTPHTTNADQPAHASAEWKGAAPYGTGREGKYAYPSWGKNGHMLVSYSEGYVNWFSAVCTRCALPEDINTAVSCQTAGAIQYNTADPYPNGSWCESLKSGIYLIKNAGTAVVTDPTDTNQLVELHNDPNYNELFPRALVPYNDVFGQAAPDVLPSTRVEASSEYLAKGEPSAIIGTSSMLNRESDHDHRFKNNDSREIHGGEWRIQGTDVGIFSDSDVYGVRILAIPELVYTTPIYTHQAGVDKYLEDSRLRNQPKRFGSTHDESWEIIGEFPLTYKGVTDIQGNPDTSWWAKIPADTPHTIQAIDSNGMTLYSETVWRSLAPGEQRTDCGGCHAHSTETTPLDFSETEAGKGTPITNVVGISDSDPVINKGYWDLTEGFVPLIAEGGGVDLVAGGSVEYEYIRDIKPIFEAKCNSCHTAGGSGSVLILDDGQEWGRLANNTDSNYKEPQMSKYIRSPQARMSQLVWVAWGQRLDGRTNATRGDDVDYPDAHPVLNLTFDEKRKIARWVDLGAPSNIPGFTTDGFGYEDDNQLPVVHIYSPRMGGAPNNQNIRIGISDAQSNINWNTLSITYYDVSAPNTVLTVSNFTRDNSGIVNATMPSLTQGNDYVLKVTVADSAGNTETKTSRFTAQAAIVKPSQVSNIQVTTQ